MSIEIQRYLGDDGELLRESPFSQDEMVRGYRAVRRARYCDEKFATLQRQGRLGVYPYFRGQEAAQVGAALALEGQNDWLVPSYRETATVLTHGLPLERIILYWRVVAEGSKWPREHRILPYYISIGTQLTQAVGVAAAGAHLRDDRVVLTTIGDGGTSQGEFHEALNFASVFGAPVVFLVTHNGWAISVPSHKQFKVDRLSRRAESYGIPGVSVDGNDLLAVWANAREAVGRARRGEGPTLLEAVTYRVMPHTTSDDPTRYRDEGEAREWLEHRCPVRRMRRALERLELWSEEHEAALMQELEAEMALALERADAVPELPAFELAEHVFAIKSPDQIRDYRALGGAL